MTLSDQFAARARQWKRFHEWERRHPPPQRDPAAVLADLGMIWSWCPEQTRLHDPDPEKLGIQRMRRILAHLDKSQ